MISVNWVALYYMYIGLLVSERLMKVARVPRLFDLNLGDPYGTPRQVKSIRWPFHADAIWLHYWRIECRRTLSMRKTDEKMLALMERDAWDLPIVLMLNTRPASPE